MRQLRLVIAALVVAHVKANGDFKVFNGDQGHEQSLARFVTSTDSPRLGKPHPEPAQRVLLKFHQPALVKGERGALARVGHDGPGLVIPGHRHVGLQLGE